MPQPRYSSPGSPYEEIVRNDQLKQISLVNPNYITF